MNRNIGYIFGGICTEPKRFENADGSYKYKFTIASNRTDNKTNYIDLEYFVPLGFEDTYGYLLKKGKLIHLLYTIKAYSFVDKQGIKVFKTILNIKKISTNNPDRLLDEMVEIIKKANEHDANKNSNNSIIEIIE